MKFVHIADAHFDKPYTELAKFGLGEERRLAQREVFRKVIEYIKKNDVEYLFISGDLYEQEYIRESTIVYIDKLFREIPNTKIFISPGNHDPFIKNSYYNCYEWGDNVYIFTPEIGIYEEKYIDIYGFGYPDFNIETIDATNKIEIKNKNKMNFLVIHGNLNQMNQEEKYWTISFNELKNMGFDYVALGHIHKSNFQDEKYKDNLFIYPGSIIANGFDEKNKHGMIVGNVDEATKQIDIEFIELDTKEFIEKNIEISDINSIEELIETIENEFMNFKYNNCFIQVNLIGTQHFEINLNNILNQIRLSNILKVKNYTKKELNLEILAKESSLRGIFTKELMNRLHGDEENDELILNAIEIGLNAIENLK